MGALLKEHRVKIYISFDLEGMGCITHGDQIPDEGIAWELREQITRELNAIMAGAERAGATSFLVNDTHSPSHNCIPALLNPKAEYLGGWGQPWTTLQDLDESFAAVFLIGQHAMAGHPVGNLSHTWLPKILIEVRLNDHPIGEIGLNALLAGCFGVPVALVTGDKAACEEAQSLLGDVETVVIKHSVSRQSARLIHPELLYERLQEAASRAILRLPYLKPYRPEPPLRLTLRWSNPMFAQLISMIPGATQEDSCTVGFVGKDGLEVYRFFFTATSMSFAFHDRLY